MIIHIFRQLHDLQYNIFFYSNYIIIFIVLSTMVFKSEIDICSDTTDVKEAVLKLRICGIPGKRTER